MLSTSQQKLQMGQVKPLSRVMYGGAQGRPAEMHMGVAARAGGMNSQGTPAAINPFTGGTGRSSAPRAANASSGALRGRFQYGDGQWAGMTRDGSIVHGNKRHSDMPIIGANQVRKRLHQMNNISAWHKLLSKARPEAAWYEDPTFNRNMSDARYEHRLAGQGAKDARDQLRDDRRTGNRDIEREYLEARTRAAAAHGAANIGSSGIANHEQARLSTLSNSQLSDLTKKYQMQMGNINRRQKIHDSRLSQQEAAERGLARKRWELENPGSAPPKGRKPGEYYRKNGQWYHVNKDGLHQTWSHGGKK